MNNKRSLILIAVFSMALLVLINISPTNSATNFGRWRDINPTQYSTDATGTIRGVYVRSGGTGSIGAGDGWAVGGDAAVPIISHYDGFSWELRNSPIATAVYNSVHFCTAPGAPGVGLCSSNGDGSDGWIVGGATGAAAALYFDGSALTPVTTGLSATVVLNSVFMVCHSPPSGTGCPGSLAAGLTYAVGTDTGVGVIYAFNGNPKGSGGWVPQTVTPATATSYNGVYMYIDQTGNLAGFAVGADGWVATLSSGGWTATQIPSAVGVNFNSVFVDQGNPADAWAVGGKASASGQIWWFSKLTGIWTGPVSPTATPIGISLTSVFLTSTSEGWIVGTAGTILHSTTLGSSNVWLDLQPNAIQTAVGSGLDLMGTSFPAGGNGWAVGTSGVIIHTENSGCGSAVPNPCWGGSTSITQVTTSQALNAVFELGSNDAWAGGSWDTTSGIPSLIHWDGDKWHRATVSPTSVLNPDVVGIFMLSSGEGWAVGGSTSTPEALKWGGNSWTGQPISNACSPCEPKAVFMISGGTGGDGFAVGTGGNIWRYQGGSWGLPFGGLPTDDLNGVFISNPGSNTNAGWAVGNTGRVLKLSITMGVPSWAPVSVTGITTQNLHGVYFKDSNHGWIVGSSATIVSTTDGGNSWSGGANQVNFAPAGTNLQSVFVDTFGTGSGNGDGWAVGLDGSGNSVFAHWDGSAWESMPVTGLQAGLGLHSVSLTSPTDGFAVGAGLTAGTSLSGIFHLDPPNPPVSGPTTVTTAVATTTSSTPTTTVATTSSSSSQTTSQTTTSNSATTSQTATQVTSQSSSTQASSVKTSTAKMTTTVVSTPTTQSTSSSTITPVALPGIPGFPWESIIAGIIVGLTALGVIRRRRQRTT